MAEEVMAVEVEGELRQVKSMADASFNITINLPEYCVSQAGIMLAHIHDRVKAVIQFIPTETNNDRKRTKRY